MPLAYNPGTGFGTAPPVAPNPAPAAAPPMNAAQQAPTPPGLATKSPATYDPTAQANQPGAVGGAGQWQQPSNAYPQSPYPMPPQQAPATATPPQQSVGSQALSNNNPQNIQNYMSALNNVGAGSNNSFNASAGPQQAQAQNLYTNPAGGLQTNGGTVSYYGGGAGGQGTQNAPAPSPSSQAYTPPGMNSVPYPTPIGAQQAPTPPGMTSVPYPTPAPAMPIASTPPGMSSLPYPDSMSASSPASAAPYSGSAAGLQLVSDIEAKTDIRPIERKLEDFLGNLGAHSYEYKDPADGEGRYVSPMAQELEKSELGKSMVIERPDGKKMVDYGRGFGFVLASQAYMNKRLNDIEKSFSLKRKK